MHMRRRLALFAAVAATMLAVASTALADGTETLGPPSISIASGTNAFVAGVGMHAFPNMPNTFSFSVPSGATVKQVLLYWEGHWTNHDPHVSNTPQVDGDNMISVNGTPVAGTKIGGSTAFFQQFAGAVDGTEMFVAYRADITGLGLVAAGANTLIISDMLFASNFPAGSPFNQGNDGVGVLVIYEDSMDSAVVGVRDGLDLAFAGFAPPLDTTVPQTFTFSPAPSSRPGTLATMAGGVRGPDLDVLRGNILRVTFDVGAPVDLVNPWQSNQGFEFDALNSSITIPAGASSLTVQALSTGGVVPSSFAWIAASLAIENPPTNGNGQGCTPGYWKNHDGSKRQGDTWPPTGYSQTQLLSSVFSPTGLGTLGSSTLREALDFDGGPTIVDKKKILLRHAVAALLNSAHPDVAYGMTTAEVISAVNAALESDNATTIEDLKDELDALNNAGCPLGRA
jgi:hypothetical protein